MENRVYRVAIFASGEGSNAEAIGRYFAERADVKIALMVCNRDTAGVYARMQHLGIPCHHIDRSEWLSGSAGKQVLDLMHCEKVDWIVLAGFLAYIPETIVHAYRGHIVNIHPSLLPKYGGKGMWGHHVHEAVIAAHEGVSGITIHHVSETMDEGSIIFQTQCKVFPDDTPETLARRIHQLEYENYPRVLDNLITGK